MDDVGWCIIVILISSFAAFFFSLHKLALSMFSKVRLCDAYEEAGKSDKTELISQNQERLVLVCSFFLRIANLITFISIAFFVFRTGQIPAAADFIIIFALCAVLSIFNLAVPFAWAKYSGEKILVRTYPVLLICSAIAFPFLKIFQINDILVRRLSGFVETTADKKQDQQQEEFLNEVEERMMEGVVDSEQQEMIEHVLELGETCADEIMTPRTDVVALNVQSNLETVLDVITSAGHSRIPVYEDNIDKIIGMVYAKDLLTEIGKDPLEFDLHKKLRKPYFVPESKPLKVLLNEFKKSKLHIAVVLDEYGGTAGIVTIEDILEQLVGDIEDEYEQPSKESFYRIDENTADVDARIYIDDFNNDFNVELPEDQDYDTLGGFVFSHLGYIPKSGEQFEHNNIKFTIAQADERSIKRIKVEKIAQSKSAEQ